MGKKKKLAVFSGIGGQAVLEGIMMKNKDSYSVAVRLPDNTIKVEKWQEESILGNSFIKKLPFIRGVFNFIDSMVLGMKTLTYSASFFEEEEQDDKPTFLDKIFGEKAESVVMGITTFISIIFAVGLFMVLPYAASEFLSRYIQNDSLVAIIEGVIRLLIFLLYVMLISLMKDIHRLYQYHGAEHKCINCIEKGHSLTVANVMRSSRQHRRCGTSFLLIVMIISIVLFFFIRVEAVWLKVLLRLILIPVIAGISYEILRLAGRYDNFLIRIISAPGMCLQLITTKEPDEQMVEVAIKAVEEVFDWKAFQQKNFKKKIRTVDVTDENGNVTTLEETVSIDVAAVRDELEMLNLDDEDILSSSENK